MSEERNHQGQVIAQKKRRLNLLKVRAAREGATVDPKVTMEIEDLEEEIPRLENALTPKAKAPPQANRTTQPKPAPQREFVYDASSLADVDFPMREGDPVCDLVKNLRIPTWHIQSPAVNGIFKLKWSERTPDEVFVLGRNLYQCACGGEFKAVEILRGLRKVLSRVPDEWSVHLVNGMFYEIYFDHEGEFRGDKLKDGCIDELFALEKVRKFESCVGFIREAVEPHRSRTGVLPSAEPEVLTAVVEVMGSDPAIITSITCNGKEQLSDDDDQYTPRNFVRSTFEEKLRKFWKIPTNHFGVEFSAELDSECRLRIAKGKTIGTLEV